MYKLLAFDLDHTLSDPDRPIHPDILQFLRKAEDQGIKIAIISGRPAMYLGGLGRQLGLKEPIIAGENGAHIYYQIGFPPKKVFTHEVHPSGKQKLDHLRSLVQKNFGHTAWIQPNFTNFAVFPMKQEVRDELLDFVTHYYHHVIDDQEYTFYVHPDDSFEIVPPGIDKGVALNIIMDWEGITKEQVIAVGNSANDLPMLREAGIAIGIGLHEADYTVSHIKEAIGFIKERLNIQLD